MYHDDHAQETQGQAMTTYKEFDKGVAPEQAHGAAKSMMTEWYWSGSQMPLLTCALRCKPDTA